MPGNHLKHSGFTYSACAPFTKKNKNKQTNKDRIQKVKETKDLRLHLSKQTRKSLFSTWHGLRGF